MSRTKYTVLVDDNFHYMDESERYKLGSFRTLARAIAACKKIVDRCLKDTYTAGMTASELSASFAMFGDDPFIVSEGQSGVPFSARDYATERCKEICGGAG